MSTWRRLFHFEPRLDQQVEDILKSGKAISASVSEHLVDTENPHQVTPAQIGAETPAGAQAKADAAQAAVQANLDAHTARTDNPHQVTAAQVGLPPGAIMDFAMPTPPAGWLECDGSAVSRTTYAALFAAIGTIWGVGDGTTTFNLPDFRGEWRRGWDHGRGIDPGRAFASWQADELKSHTHAISPSSNYWVYHGGAQNMLGGYGTSGIESPTIGATGGSETRPRNHAVLVCIKY